MAAGMHRVLRVCARLRVHVHVCVRVCVMLLIIPDDVVEDGSK